MSLTMAPPRTPQARPRLFALDEYERLAEVGILGPEDRVELIEGEIVQMGPMTSGHAAAIRRISLLFTRLARDRYQVSTQMPLRLGDESEPEPDVALVKARTDFYESRHPGPDDVLLVVEVAESSLEYDRRVKVPMYARHGVGEVWLVDLAARCVEVYREPRESGYRTMERVEKHETLSIQLLEDVTIAAEGFFGKL